MGPGALLGGPLEGSGDRLEPAEVPSVVSLGASAQVAKILTRMKSPRRGGIVTGRGIPVVQLSGPAVPADHSL